MSAALNRIAAALERLVSFEEAREARACRRRGGHPAKEIADEPIVDELAMRRAQQVIDEYGLLPTRPKRGSRHNRRA